MTVPEMPDAPGHDVGPSDHHWKRRPLEPVTRTFFVDLGLDNLVARYVAVSFRCLYQDGPISISTMRITNRSNGHEQGEASQIRVTWM